MLRVRSHAHSKHIFVHIYFGSSQLCFDGGVSEVEFGIQPSVLSKLQLVWSKWFFRLWTYFLFYYIIFTDILFSKWNKNQLDPSGSCAGKLVIKITGQGVQLCTQTLNLCTLHDILLSISEEHEKIIFKQVFMYKFCGQLGIIHG